MEESIFPQNAAYEYEKKMLEFSFAGGAMEVGGSCIYLRIGETGILMDCGIRQSGGDSLPDLRMIQEKGGVDTILVSHAHMDHIGALPIISKAYPAAPIYMTSMTAALSRVLLFDSLKIMDHREEELPVFSERDVLDMLGRVRPLGFESRRHLLPDIFVTAYPAGHIAGAACLYLETPEGCIFYSGDLSGFSQQSIPGARLPKLRPDVAILESTYGDRLHASRTLEEKRLIDIIREVTEGGGKVLVPAFALGRAQEVLLLLRSAMTKGSLPKLPVYTDGMVRDINRVYQSYPGFLNASLARRIQKGQQAFYTDEIQPVPQTADRAALFHTSGPAVFVASSGMLTGGPSASYARMIAGDAASAIVLTGYQDEESPGRMLLQLLESKSEREGGIDENGAGTGHSITIDGTSIAVACRVEQVGLSAHADQTELAGVVERLSARRVILVHGNESAIRALGTDLIADHRRQIWTPACGETIGIGVHKKREQLRRVLPYAMQREGLPGEKDLPHLRSYWMEHYPNRSLTSEQAAFIWTGRNLSEEDPWIQTFVQTLVESMYFIYDPRRMFLLRPVTEEELEEARKKTEPTMQDVEAAIRANAGELPIRKISYHQDRRQAVITVDFPDALDPSQLQACRNALQRLAWSLQLNPATNHQAMQTLLRKMFGIRLGKVSYYIDRQLYEIALTENAEEDHRLAEVFLKETGWGLIIRGTETPGMIAKAPGARSNIVMRDDWFVPEDGVRPLEQNMVLQCIDAAYEQLLQEGAATARFDAPYKKGIKTDAAGKYVELSFLSPAVGRRHPALLRQLAEQGGWRIHIADSVNVNQIFALITQLLAAYGLEASKNPSWHPQENCFRVKIAQGEMLPALAEEFRQMTGCEIQ